MLWENRQKICVYDRTWSKVAKPSPEGGGGAGLKRVHYKPQNTPKAVTNHSVTSKVEKNVKESKEKDVEAQKISPVNAIRTEGVGSNTEKHADAIRSVH